MDLGRKDYFVSPEQWKKPISTHVPSVNFPELGSKQSVPYPSHFADSKASPQYIKSDPEPSRQPVRRNYHCGVCSFITSKAKLYLYHRRLIHKEEVNIFPCKICDYAAEKKSRTLRHLRSVHKDSNTKLDSIQDDQYSNQILKMSDENQNEICGEALSSSVEEVNETDEFEEEEEEFENEFEVIDEEISFKSPSSQLKDGGKGIQSDNVNDYLNCVSSTSNDTPATYQCRLCSFDSELKWKTAAHIRTQHLKQTVFKCPYCDFVCRRKTEWCVHKSMHTNKTVFSCKECRYQTTMKRNYDRHQARHGGNGPIKCLVCSYSSTGESAIQRHMAEYHCSPEKDKENVVESTKETDSKLKNVLKNGSESVDNFICTFCNLNFRTEAKLRQHMISHSDAAPHVCPVCSLRYKRPADLNRHMKRKHDTSLQDYQKNENWLNKSGDDDYADNYDRFSPGRESSQQSLDNSEYSLSQDEPLNLSVKKSPNYNQDEPLDLTTPRKSDYPDITVTGSPFRCEDCDFSTHSTYAYEFHRQEMHTANFDGHECTICDSVFERKFELKAHMVELHNQSMYDTESLNDEEEMIQCRYCTYVGKTKLEVRQHETDHTGEKLWSCLFCSFNTNILSDISLHLRENHPVEMTQTDFDRILSKTYQGDINEFESIMMEYESSADSCRDEIDGKKSNYSCTFCSFVCDAPSKMKCHMEIHGNLKRFMCQHCGRRSNWLWDVRKHIKREHPGQTIDVVELPEEEARSTLEEYLKNHPANYTSLSSGSEFSLRDYTVKPTDRCRPFMCSVCGRRSNWKWDMNKHIRTTHPSGHLVELTEQEAKDTFDDYEKSLQLQNLIAQNERRNLVNAPEIPVKTRDQSENETDEIKQLVNERMRPFKCSTCGKRSNWRWDLGKHIKVMHQGHGEIIVLRGVEARQGVPIHSTPVKPSVPSPQKRAASQSHIDLSKLKRFKCSQCPYRSNFRSDIGRHIKRKHHRGFAKVIQLDPKEAAETLEEYHQTWARKKFVPTPTNSSPEKLATALQLNNKRQKLESNGESAYRFYSASKPSSHPDKVCIVSKQWQCNHCKSFQHDDKQVVLKHVAAVHPSSGAYVICRECGDTFSTQRSLREHAQKEHGTIDEEGEDEEDDIKEVEVESEVSRSSVIHMLRCRLCGKTSTYKSVLRQHAVDEHSTADESLYLEEFYKMKDFTPPRLSCQTCPFTAAKQVVMDLHLPHHQPQPGNPYKCPHCPYWVREPAALNHHVRIHSPSYKIGQAQKNQDIYDFSNNNDGAEEQVVNKSPSKAVGRSKHYCEYCPYVSANRNDYLYHKQFHRPKPAAPFKCDHCQYWVSLRRLLKQHVKVHTKEYLKKYRSDPRPINNTDFSPAKSDSSFLSADEILEMAQLKQQIIASKITSVVVTPEKVHNTNYTPEHGTPLVKSMVMGNAGEYLGQKTYRTMLKCRYCPYRNVRSTNLKLHEKMHGKWDSGEEQLLKCSYCDYHVGNAGVLARHIKVHSANYDPSQDDMNDIEVTGKLELESDHEDSSHGIALKDKEIKEALSESDKTKVRQGGTLDARQLPQRSDFYLKESTKGDGMVLEKAVFRKWSCERCPYATMKRSQFEKHMMLHGCKQKYICEYCDYSVPNYHLLLQHKKLHMMPNMNLLSVQSLSNLQKLPEVPADIAIAGNLQGDVQGLQDQLDLYENSAEFVEPKQLYRCDKCPYSNIRRDHLLQHMKFHMVKSELQCPYCTYSVSKTHLLNQHIKVHFNTAGSEMSAYSKASIEEVRKSNNGDEQCVDLSEISRSVETAANDKKEESNKKTVNETKMSDVKQPNDAQKSDDSKSMDDIDEEQLQMANDVLGDGDDALESNASCDDEKEADVSGVAILPNDNKLMNDAYTNKEEIDMNCKYCYRAFVSVELLIRHERMHTLGMTY